MSLHNRVKLEAFGKIALVGDGIGLPRLLKYIPAEDVGCLIAASIRPQYLQELDAIARARDKPLLIQPKSSNLLQIEEFLEDFRRLGCNSLISHSYSLKLPTPMLDVVRNNAVNIHAAFLPKNRGPNPIQWTIIRGENSTGVTAHQMTDRIDAGPILDQIPVAIDPRDTWVSLRDKINEATEVLLQGIIPKVIEGSAICTPQEEDDATTNSRLTPESPKIDFRTMSDKQIYDLIRAQVNPLSGAFLEDENARRFHFKEFVPLKQVSLMREFYLRNGLEELIRMLEHKP